MEQKERERAFCGAYLRCMDPQRAAREVGADDGYALLKKSFVKKELKRMREFDRDICREDVIRRLCEMAFGRANDAVKLALGEELSEKTLETLDLSAVSEFKRGSNGSVEVKFIDRTKALDILCGLLSGGDEDSAAAEFFRTFNEVQEDEAWED